MACCCIFGFCVWCSMDAVETYEVNWYVHVHVVHMYVHTASWSPYMVMYLLLLPCSVNGRIRELVMKLFCHIPMYLCVYTYVSAYQLYVRTCTCTYAACTCYVLPYIRICTYAGQHPQMIAVLLPEHCTTTKLKGLMNSVSLLEMSW